MERTVEGFAVDFFVAIVLGDEVVEFLLWVPFCAYLVFFVDEVSRVLWISLDQWC